MTDEERDLLLPRLGTTAALYIAFAVLPALMLSGGSAWWAWERFTLAPGTHLVPMVDRMGWFLAGAFLIGVPVSLMPALLLGVRRIPGTSWKIGAATALAMAHTLLLALSLVSVGAVLGDALDGERLMSRADEPGGTRRAMLYRESRSCAWAVYVGEPLEPVAHQHTRVECDCDDFRDATMVWTGANPDLLDPTGQPFTCRAKGCATTGFPGALAVILGALGIRRGRGRCARAPSARSRPPGGGRGPEPTPASASRR